MDKKMWMGIGIIIGVIIAFIFVRSYFGVSEDNWIKDSRGVYIKHGNPTNIPEEVRLQNQAIIKGIELFVQEKAVRNISSQCLGVVGNYAIDIVHSPRTAEDNKPENQCDSYNNHSVSHFIELDKGGKVIRII